MSAKSRIERLKFTTFRGATKPVVFEFKENTSVILIFGENGTGKSTIADAVDFLCNGDFGSLRLRSGTKPASHIVSALGHAKDLEVEMVYGGTTWQARLQKNKPVTTPAHPPRAFVLRRADITRVMEATDGDRYKTLQEFITVPQVERTEGTLRSLCKEVDAEVNRAVQQKTTAENTLEQFWIAEGRPLHDPISWARAAIQQPIDALSHQIQRDRAFVVAIDKATQAEQQWIASEQSAQAAQAQLNIQRERLERASSMQTSADLLNTLQAAHAYLQSHPEATHCPVCAKPEPHASLTAQIEGHLAQLAEVQQIHRDVQRSEQSVQQAQGALAVAQEGWRSTFAALVEWLRTHGAMHWPELHGLVQAEIVGAPHHEQQALLAEIAEHRQALQNRIAQAEKQVSQHNALTTHLATIDELNHSLLNSYAIARRLQAMLIVVEEERKRFVQETVDAISSTVTGLYQRIHPNEPLGEPAFGVKEKAIGSLTLTGRFGHHKEVPPAAYYSEAHLDTLGLCVFLALAKQTTDAVIVLDDVLMSIDDPHLDRVIDVINEEAPHFGHVIITTHSRTWFDRVRLGQGMKAELLELYGWNLDHGMHHSAAPMVVDELRHAVHAPRLDRQAVASRAGILLEQLLDDLTLRYRCSMPRNKQGEYTLGDLSSGIDKKFGKLLRTEHCDSAGNVVQSYEIYPLIAAATTDTWIRNEVGAHFNVKASGISDSMVKQFGERVLALADALLCQHCQQLPRKNKSGSYWECGWGCGKIRLYPLQTPS